MLRFTNGAVAPVDGHQLHQIVGEGPLLRNGELLMEEGIVHWRAFGLNPVNQRSQLLPKGGEEPIQLRLFQSPLILVQADVIGIPGRIEVSGKPALGFYDLLQAGSEGGEIVVPLGPMPDGIRLVEQLGVLNVFRLRHLADPLVFPVEHFHLTVLQRGELSAVLPKEGQQPAYLGIGKYLIGQPAERAQSFAPAPPAVLRRGGHRVAVDQPDGVLIGVTGLFQLCQLFQCFLYGHFVFFLSAYRVRPRGLCPRAPAAFLKKGWRKT